MSYNDALRWLVADKLGVLPSQMKSVRVIWDDGDRYDPTYGDSPNAAPTFEIEVTMCDGTWKKLDTAWTFSALLSTLLGIEKGWGE